MWNPFKKRDDGDKLILPTCKEHESVVKKLARIEGENIVIIILLTTILVVVLERLI